MACSELHICANCKNRKCKIMKIQNRYHDEQESLLLICLTCNAVFKTSF